MRMSTWRKRQIVSLYYYDNSIDSQTHERVSGEPEPQGTEDYTLKTAALRQWFHFKYIFIYNIYVYMYVNTYKLGVSLD